MDTAVKSLNAILSGGDYEFFGDVPVFDAHDEYDQRKFIPDGKGGKTANPNYGKLLRKFDKKRLEEIVTVCNKRRNETGDLAPIGPGHTLTDGKETDQPSIWGYAAGEYKVGEFGPQKKLGILAGFYMRRRIEMPDGKVMSGKEALQEFPRRSIELWHKDSMIDWIALLKRTPERDLGLTAQPYAKDRYAPWGMRSEISLDVASTHYLRASGNGHKLRYSMDEGPENLVGQEQPDQPDQPDDPTKPPDTSVTPADHPLSPEEASQANRFLSHYMKTCPWMQDAQTKYSAAMASPTNAMPGQDEPPQPDADPGKEKLNMAKTEEDLQRFQKENDELKTKLAEQTARADRQERLAKYSKALAELADEGYQLKVDEEVIDCAEFTQPQFDKHVERIKKNYAKEEKPPTDGLKDIEVDMPLADKGKLSEADMEKSVQYMRQKGCTFEEAVSHYKKTR